MGSPARLASAQLALLDAYARARDYVDRDLVRETPRRRDPEGKVQAALRFNRLLGDPQRAYPSIQVAGTSGKGTVASWIAASLHESGLRTGLHVSPYLQVFVEKTWIEGRICDVEALTRAVEAVRPVAERFRHDDDCPASVHGMASLAVSFESFREAETDAVVVETGMGGRFDLVQGLRRSLCVITDLGLDHTLALGPGLERIAWHKAGIMEAGVSCVAVRGPAWEVLETEASRCSTRLIGVEPADVVVDSQATGDHTAARLRLPTLGEVDLRLPGTAPFLVRNAAVAAMALDRLAREGWRVGPEDLRAGFAHRLPGRFEIVQRAPRVVLDGAHNVQKLDALLQALGRPRRLVVVLGATGRRPPAPLIERFAPLRPLLLATQLDLYGKTVVPCEEIASTARRIGLEARAVPSPERALDLALEEADPETTVLVTGSIYLIGRLRSRWYPWEQVLLQRTSWPDWGADDVNPAPEDGQPLAIGH